MHSVDILDTLCNDALSVCLNRINIHECVSLKYIQEKKSVHFNGVIISYPIPQVLLTFLGLMDLLFSNMFPLPRHTDPQSKGHCMGFQQITKMTKTQPDIHPHRCTLLHVYSHANTNPVLCY